MDIKFTDVGTDGFIDLLSFFNNGKSLGINYKGFDIVLAEIKSRSALLAKRSEDNHILIVLGPPYADATANFCELDELRLGIDKFLAEPPSVVQV